MTTFAASARAAASDQASAATSGSKKCVVRFTGPTYGARSRARAAPA